MIRWWFRKLSQRIRVEDGRRGTKTVIEDGDKATLVVMV
jgi:hypothetical protein